MRRGPARHRKVAAIAARHDLSASTLYAYLAGTTLPASDVLDALLQDLGVPPAEQRRLATARDALSARRRRKRPEPEGMIPPPRELPIDPAGFTGRHIELERLDGVLAGTVTPPASIAVISGPAGIGKTALAVRWAHGTSERFPDGCLYADLRGYAPGQPRRPGDVLAAFLRSLGVPADQIPDDVEERAGRFRSQVAGRRLLVVLDNALDTDQVRPLLPGDTGSFTVITGRAALTALRVSPGAHQIVLDPLSSEHGKALLWAHRERSPAEDAALDALVRRCAGLPIALRIVAARLTARPGRTPQNLTEDLLAGPGLEGFELDDTSASIRAIFSWSEERLPQAVIGSFRMLGAVGLTDFSRSTAKALLDLPEATAQAHLDALCQAYLLQRPHTGRYAMHDLVREYAREQSAAHVPPEDRQLAATRLVNAMIAGTSAAMADLHPDEDATRKVPHSLTEAQAWLDTEWPNLRELVDTCAATERPDLVRRVVDVLRRHLDQGARHHDALVLLDHALAADRALGDVAAEGRTRSDLGVACMRLGRYDEARTHYERALEICREHDDPNGEAGTLNNLGNLFERLGDLPEAARHYRMALPIAERFGYRRGAATLHTNLGWINAGLGDLNQARSDTERAAAIFTEIGDTGGRARALGNLAEVERRSGHPAPALDLLDRALDAAREIGAAAIETELLNTLGHCRLDSGDAEAASEAHDAALAAARHLGDRYEEARALRGLGHIELAAGQTGRARRSWQASVAVLRELGLSEAQEVEALLRDAAVCGDTPED